MVRRSGNYFTPHIGDQPSGLVVWVHEDDVTEEGRKAFEDALAEQMQRWEPRSPGSPRGRQIPFTMDRRQRIEHDIPLIVEDRPDFIHYTVRASLITERAARALTRAQSKESANWQRRPARRTSRTAI
ncbi:hypothetical protein ACFC5H_09045 [Streptomyces rochei]|uniref:hypothetical protein n=1 Tax=Actinomycetes TaxID=1760 RepID=UPI0034158BC3